jgi:hypothetical protein
MRWLFPAEKEAHRAGLIDWFLYQTDSVRGEVEPILREINPTLRQAVVDPYFHLDGFEYREDKPVDRFRFCRISREDLGKFHVSQLWVYETMVAPVLKEGTILGVNEAVRMKLANGGASIPEWIRTLPAGGEPVRDIYARSHALIQMADPSLTENLPRVGFEAMATGTALCVDRRGAGWSKSCMGRRDFYAQTSVILSTTLPAWPTSPRSAGALSKTHATIWRRVGVSRLQREAGRHFSIRPAFGDGWHTNFSK